MYQYNYDYQGNVPPEVVAGGVMLFGTVFFIFFIIAIAFYVIVTWSLMRIAKKTGTEPAWLAWIPIANLLLLLMIAKKPLWWFLLMLIPIVNLIISIIVWLAILERINRPSWWILLIIFIPIIALPVLAFSKD